MFDYSHDDLSSKYNAVRPAPMVSVIVPTKNSAATIYECLTSIVSQTYKNIELIVVDNFSIDDTASIASSIADVVLLAGPERSAQVNYAVTKSHGEYIYKVDSDFILEPTVVEECVQAAAAGFDAAVVHNSPDARISWIAAIRKFEVDMYKYDLTHASARFIKREVFEAIGGYDSTITAGEDYDFQNKLNRYKAKTCFIHAEALHIGEPTSMLAHLKKYYAYGIDFVNYGAVTSKSEKRSQIGFVRSAYLKNWLKFARRPVMGTVFLFYHVAKYVFGGAGYLAGLLQLRRNKVKGM